MARLMDIVRKQAPLLTVHLPFFLFFPSLSMVRPLCLAVRRRAGQTTVEYLLMLAIISSLTLIMGILFHKKLLGGMFTLVGLVIGAGRRH